MRITSEYRTCARCQVSKPLKEYDTFATKPGRKKVCPDCLEVMRLRRDKLRKGEPVPPRRYGPRPRTKKKVVKPRPPEPVIIPTDGIPWPASK